MIPIRKWEWVANGNGSQMGTVITEIFLFFGKMKNLQIFSVNALELAIHRKNVFHVEQLGDLAAMDIGIVACLGVDKSPRLCIHHAIGNATLLAKTLS